MIAAAKIGYGYAKEWHCQDNCLYLVEKIEHIIQQSKNYVFLPSDSEIT